MDRDPREPETLAALLAAQAGARGDATAIREKRRGIWQGTTWRDLAEQAGALSGALATRGLGRGDHMALIGENRPALFVSMAAAHRLGAVTVPLYPDASAAEVAAQIVACGARVVFAENQEQVDKILRILPRCPSVQAIVYDDDRGMRGYAQPILAAHRALLAEGRQRGTPPPPPHGSGDDPAFVFLTSATAGPAKAVTFSHRALIGAARRLVAADGLGADDVTLAFLPPGWMCQTLFTYAAALVAGHCLCCPESPDTLLEDMREIAPTTLLTTPRMLDAILSQVSFRIEDTGGIGLALYRRAMAHAEARAGRALAGAAPGLADRVLTGLFDLLITGPLRDSLGMSRLRSVYCTGDALDPGMLGAVRALGVNLKQLYGTTETGFLVAMHRDGDVRPDTVGQPLEGVEVALSPQGEIRVRLSGPAATLPGPAADPGGWIATGDVGRLDARGHLHVEGRLDSRARLASGTVFSPRLIESRIRMSPHVREAVVIGDGRDSVCALVDIDTLAVGKWADGHEIPYMGHPDLASQDQVYGLIAGWISEVNAGLAADPALAPLQVRRFVLLPKELTAEDGLLTRTGKLRRGAVAERFAALIEALYAGDSEAMLTTADTQEHGTAAPAGLKIREARVVDAGPNRRAA